MAEIVCPHCNGLDAFTVDSRYCLDTQARRRRYECSRCEQRFTTYEVPAVEYEKIQTMNIDTKQFDSVIASLRAIKAQFGQSNGTTKD